MTRSAPAHRFLFKVARLLWVILAVLSLAAFTFGLLATLRSLDRFPFGLLDMGTAGESVALLGISLSAFVVLRIIQETILFAINIIIGN